MIHLELLVQMAFLFLKLLVEGLGGDWGRRLRQLLARHVRRINTGGPLRGACGRTKLLLVLVESLQGGDVHTDLALVVLGGALARAQLTVLAWQEAESFDRPALLVRVQKLLVAVGRCKTAEKCTARTVVELSILW